MTKRLFLFVCLLVNCLHATEYANNKAYILENTIQEYAWGSKQAMASFLGYPCTNRPMAELWMGAHPKAPSQIIIDNISSLSLLVAIEQHAQEILGFAIAAKYNNTLPFLFKVLAIDQPLSLQVHPNKNQAKEGYNRENSLNIPLDAAYRNYKDLNHKPELFCALTPFWGLNGFKPLWQIVETIQTIKSPLLHEISKQFINDPTDQNFRIYFKSLFNLEFEQRQAVVSQVVAFVQDHIKEAPIYHWMLVYHNLYPGDISVLVCLFLKLVYLEPGQALFVDAGQIHAYLEGMGIEIMANSDNVLRAGGTNKHIDPDELLRIMSFEVEEKKDTIIYSRACSTNEKIYDVPTEDFQLSLFNIYESFPFISKKNRSVEILICISGHASFIDIIDGTAIELVQGISIIVPASLEQYKIQGNAVLYKATVPIKECLNF